MKCRRVTCTHTFNQHNDLRECKRCKCGYFLMYDLMVEVELISVWKNRAGGWGSEKAALYGWFRVFEGFGHMRAMKAVNL